MITLTFDMRFATNVRFGTGSAGEGVDEVIDRAAPLSSGAIKGALRDEARWLLPAPDGDHPFVSAVFGSASGGRCPWHFEVTAERVEYMQRASLQLDRQGAVVPGALHVKEEATIPEAVVTIRQRGPLGESGLPATRTKPAADYHVALLRLCAAACEKLGQSRTRGMGWVAISPPSWTPAADLELIWQVREGDAR